MEAKEKIIVQVRSGQDMRSSEDKKGGSVVERHGGMGWVLNKDKRNNYLETKNTKVEKKRTLR